MIILEDFVHLAVSADFWSLFLVVIQLGAIIAVIVLYFRRLNPWSRFKEKPERRDTWKLWAKIIVACIPAAAIGFLFDSWIEAHFFNSYVVTAALVAYGIAFILVERWQSKRGEGHPIGKHSALLGPPLGAGQEGAGALAGAAAGAGATPAPATATTTNNAISFVKALAIGCFQCLAVIPGTSRSGATILGARIIGVAKREAAEFSFFLAIPVMFGASLLKVVQAFHGGLTPSTTEWGVFFVGIIVAFVVSIFAIRFLMSFIQKHSFAAFGWYRIVLGIVVFVYFIFAR